MSVRGSVKNITPRREIKPIKMLSPRAVSVVGFKASGKTRVVEALVRELTRRGHRVGTLKHTSDDVFLDTPGKDTWRHREAGSAATAILESGRGAFFIDRPMGVEEAVEALGPIDFVVLEGFKSLDTVARIIVPRRREEIGELSNGLEVAISGPAVEGLSVESEVQAIPLDRVEELADVVEKRAFPMLPRMDCGGVRIRGLQGPRRGHSGGGGRRGEVRGLLPRGGSPEGQREACPHERLRAVNDQERGDGPGEVPEGGRGARNHRA